MVGTGSSIGTIRRGSGRSGFRARDLSAPWRHIDLGLLIVVGLIILLTLASTFSDTSMRRARWPSSHHPR